jgi:ketosteroid isomerase-like protein
MKSIAVAGFALLVALAGAGCPPRPSAPTAAVLPVEFEGAVKGTIEQWRQAYEVRSMDALARLYAHEPGLTLVQDGALQLGWTTIEAALRAKLTRATSFHVRLADLQITALGVDAAVASATMTRESTDGATTVTENGVLTLALRRDDAGWVIASEHYSYKRP